MVNWFTDPTFQLLATAAKGHTLKNLNNTPYGDHGPPANQSEKIHNKNPDTLMSKVIKISSDIRQSWLCSANLEASSREKGRDLTQSYDKSPYTHRKIPKIT